MSYTYNSAITLYILKTMDYAWINDLRGMFKPKVTMQRKVNEFLWSTTKDEIRNEQLENLK